LTKLGAIVDDRQLRQPAAPAMQHTTPEQGAVPTRLGKARAAPPETGRWKRVALFWGGSLAALVLVFAGTLWVFEAPNVDHTKTVVTIPPVAPLVPELAAEPARVSSLPPLVLLAPHEVAPAKAAQPLRVPLKPVPGTAKAKALVPRKALLAKLPAPPLKARTYAALVKKPVLMAKRGAPPPRRCAPGKLAKECARRG
jgi:hypothetical protein